LSGHGEFERLDGTPEKKHRQAPREPTPGRLSSILKSIGVNRTTLAAAADVSLGTLSKINDGASKGNIGGVTVPVLVRVAWALGVRPSDLIPELHSKPKTPGLVQIIKARRKREREVAARLHKGERR
jgi:DNA-binding Xre family transcriptional regulator